MHERHLPLFLIIVNHRLKYFLSNEFLHMFGEFVLVIIQYPHTYTCLGWTSSEHFRKILKIR